MKVIITPQADKQLSKFPPNQQKRIEQKIKFLSANPYAGKALSGKLAEYYSLRIWPYRAIYIIDKERETIWITTVLHRQGAYK